MTYACIGQAQVKQFHKMPNDTTSEFNMQHEYWFMPEGVTTSAFCNMQHECCFMPEGVTTSAVCNMQHEYWFMPEGATHLQTP